MTKITKIILWLVGISLLAYFIFLPIEIKRKKPEKVSPKEETPVLAPITSTPSIEY